MAGIKPDEPHDRVGEALRQVIDQNRGQAVSGVLLITDGASNSGLPPAEAARLTREANIPLFIYGIGVTTPVDLVMKEVSAPRLAFVKERVDVKAKFSVQGVGRQTVAAVLKANGAEVDQQKVELAEDGDYEVNFRFDPQAIGISGSGGSRSRFFPAKRARIITWPRASFGWWITRSKSCSSTRSPAGIFAICWPISSVTAVWR